MLNLTSKLISIEGIEGSGKSTLLTFLKASLPQQLPQYTPHFFREPGGTSLGEKIRGLLLDINLSRSTWAEVFLFLAARSELIHQQLRPLLKKPNQLLILDRFFDSTLVYQGYCQGLDVDALRQLHQSDGLNVVPDITFYLRIDTKTSLARQRHRGNAQDYFESWNEQKTKSLVHGFDELAKKDPDRIVTIDATQSEQEIQTQVLSHLLKNFP